MNSKLIKLLESGKAVKRVRVYFLLFVFVCLAIGVQMKRQKK